MKTAASILALTLALNCASAPGWAQVKTGDPVKKSFLPVRVVSETVLQAAYAANLVRAVEMFGNASLKLSRFSSEPLGVTQAENLRIERNLGGASMVFFPIAMAATHYGLKKLDQAVTRAAVARAAATGSAR